MAEWSSSAQQSANQGMRNSSPDDPALKCKPKEWEPIVEVQEGPAWAPKVTVKEPPNWVEIALLDDAGKPAKGAKYRVELADGTVKEGTLDGNGKARVEDVPGGKCKVTFPDHDSSAVGRA